VILRDNSECVGIIILSLSFLIFIFKGENIYYNLMVNW
jgi:hypothetical protein